MPQINASCQSIVNRARLLSDTVNALYISYDDIQSSLNEAWADLYNILTDSNDDYFATLTTVSSSSSVTNSALNTNEYLLTLPSDFYKLRFIDYNYNGAWQRMRRFSLDQRNDYNNVFQYRFQDQYLWIVGSYTSGSFPNIRLCYYPGISPLYSPDTTKIFATGVADYTVQGYTYPSLVPGPNPQPLPISTTNVPPSYNGVIYQTGSGLTYFSAQTNVATALVTLDPDAKFPMYYRGYVYYINASGLQAAQFDPNNPAALTPTQVYTNANLTYMSIYDGVVYLVTTTDTRFGTLNGTGGVSTSAVTSPFTPPVGILSYAPNVSGYAMWVTSAGVLTLNNVPLSATALSLASTDGTYIYGLTGKSLYRYTVSLTTPSAPTITASEVINNNTYKTGQVVSGFLPSLQYDPVGIAALSAVPDKVISYPNNLVPEILSYQIAIDIKRKQGAKEDLAELTARKQELYLRFMDVVRRDDNTPERIRNSQKTAFNGGSYGGTW